MEKLAQRNRVEVLDLLGGRLAFERTGVTLYDTVIAKIERSGDTRYRTLVHQLREHRLEEQEHAEWLAAQIVALGGSTELPTKMSALELEESTGIKNVIVDGHEDVLHLLHALLAAELSDNAGWDLLVKLADDAGDTAAKLAFARRMAEEAKHLLFVREAVVRSAELQVLGRARPLPSDMSDVAMATLKKPLLAGGAIAALCLGAGALIASVMLANRPKLMKTTRRLFA